MTNIEDVLARARPAEREVQVCLAGDLLAEFDRLSAELETIGDTEPTSLAELPPGLKLAERIEAVRTQIRESQASFRLRAISDRAFSDLLAAHPAEQSDLIFDKASFPPALLAACAVDPQMTAEQAVQLADTLSRGEFRKLFDAAWSICTGELDIPFSARASALLARTDAK